MSCELNKNNNFLIEKVLREIEKLEEDTTARLLKQDGKIAELCVYIKDNLSDSLLKLFDSMKMSGQLDEIVTTAVLTGLSIVEVKTDHIISVKEYGAIGDGISRTLRCVFASLEQAKQVYPSATSLDNEIDGLAIQKAIDCNPGKTIFIPDGNYQINTRIVLNERLTIQGQSMNRTVLNFLNDIDDLFNAEGKTHIDISNMTLLHAFEIEQVGATNTAKAINGNNSSYSTYSNLVIKGFEYAINCGENSWCNDFENITIQSCKYGIIANGEFNNCSFIKVRATYCDTGIFIGAGRTVSMIDCQFELNNVGLYKTNLGDLYCKGCYFERNITDSSVNWGNTTAYKVSFVDCSFFKNELSDCISAHGDENTLVIVKNCSFTKHELNEYIIMKAVAGSKVKILLEDNFIQDGIKINNDDIDNLLVRNSWIMDNASKSYKHSHTPVLVGGSGEIVLDGKNDSYRIVSENDLSIKSPLYENNKNGNSFELLLVIPVGKTFTIIPSGSDIINGEKEFTNNTSAWMYKYCKLIFARGDSGYNEYIIV